MMGVSFTWAFEANENTTEQNNDDENDRHGVLGWHLLHSALDLDTADPLSYEARTPAQGADD